MKKELTLDYAPYPRKKMGSAAAFSLSGLLRQCSHLLENTRPVVWLSRQYSRLMEEPVSPRLTLRLLNAQAAALLLLGTATVNLPATLLLFLWTACALKACRRCKN